MEVTGENDSRKEGGCPAGSRTSQATKSATAAQARAERGVSELASGQASLQVSAEASTAALADFRHPEDLASMEAALAGDRRTVVPEVCSALADSA